MKSVFTTDYRDPRREGASNRLTELAEPRLLVTPAQKPVKKYRSESRNNN
jgi:hypothetical protein